jgi:hypothetical protein
MLQAFESAHKRVIIVGACKRCGLFSHEERDCDLLSHIHQCLWHPCSITKEKGIDFGEHVFQMCPIFIRTCGVPECKLRGHRTDDHKEIMESLSSLDEYVDCWEEWADEHLLIKS